jgi:hypothetical protein
MTGFAGQWRMVQGVLATIALGVALLVLAFGAILGLGSMVPILGKIPVEIQAACAAILLLAGFLMTRMMAERRRAITAFRKFSGILGAVPPAAGEEPGRALPPQRMEELRQRFGELRGEPAKWWQRLEEALVCYPSPDGRRGWYLSRSCEEVLPEEEMISPYYHFSFHQAVPAVLTALGLLATFTAILAALSQLVYNPQVQGSPVSGIDRLINGLAGKFLSSIVALLLSVIYTFLEKKVCERRLRAEYASLMYALRRRLPLLSPLQVLIDIRQSLAPPVTAAMEAWEPPVEAQEPAPVVEEEAIELESQPRAAGDVAQ